MKENYNSEILNALTIKQFTEIIELKRKFNFYQKYFIIRAIFERPVESDAEHPVLPDGPHEQVDVPPTRLSVFGQCSVL